MSKNPGGKSGYSDVPFVAGSVFGIRSWMHLKGELLSLTGRGFWTNGENMAECKPYAFASEFYSPPGEHRPASLECHCGFYATDMQPVRRAGSVFTESHAPELDNAVVGVVEGYGIVSIGSKGFRSEKARIIALVNAWYPLATWVPLLVLQPKPPKDILSANYPDALWYPDVDSMLDHHPLTDFKAESEAA